MSIRVLIADDHNLVRQALVKLLQEQEGVEVVGDVESGRAAVRAAKDTRPDLVIMDVTMPDLNGIDATRQIRIAVPNAKILALSMHREQHFITDILKAGASGYLLKTCVVGELVLAIRAINANQTYLSPEIGAIVADAYLHTSSPSSGTPAAVTLSPRQREILQLTAEGLNTKQIAQRLSRSVKTIEMHRRHTMEKLGLRSIADLTRYAIRTGLVSVDH